MDEEKLKSNEQFLYFTSKSRMTKHLQQSYIMIKRTTNVSQTYVEK